MAIAEISSPPANSFSHPIPHLRLGEFDLGGVLYHAHYYHLYEEIREAFLRAQGIPYSSLVAVSHHLAINEAHQNFLAPIFYGEALTTKLWTSDVKNSSFCFHYEISNPGGPAHYGWTRHVFVKTAGGFKVERLPEKLRDSLQSFSAADSRGR